MGTKKLILKLCLKIDDWGLEHFVTRLGDYWLTLELSLSLTSLKRLKHRRVKKAGNFPWVFGWINSDGDSKLVYLKLSLSFQRIVSFIVRNIWTFPFFNYLHLLWVWMVFHLYQIDLFSKQDKSYLKRIFYLIEKVSFLNPSFSSIKKEFSNVFFIMRFNVIFHKSWQNVFHPSPNPDSSIPFYPISATV